MLAELAIEHRVDPAQAATAERELIQQIFEANSWGAVPSLAPAELPDDRDALR